MLAGGSRRAGGLARLVADGAEPARTSPEEFAAHIRRELARWGKVIRDAHIQPD